MFSEDNRGHAQPQKSSAMHGFQVLTSGSYATLEVCYKTPSTLQTSGSIQTQSVPFTSWFLLFSVERDRREGMKMPADEGLDHNPSGKQVGQEASALYFSRSYCLFLVFFFLKCVRHFISSAKF